jgi:hypothetical protein
MFMRGGGGESTAECDDRWNAMMEDATMAMWVSSGLRGVKEVSLRSSRVPDSQSWQKKRTGSKLALQVKAMLACACRV